MYVLGVSCFYHDSAAALLEDGMLVAAAEEERFSRVKHDNSFPSRAIRFCLDQADISAGELDYVVFHEKPLVKLERILLTTLAAFPRSWRAFAEAMPVWFKEKLWIRSLLAAETGVPTNRVLFTDHHMAHAASAFFCSPYEEAAILTVDGVGEWTTTTLGHGTASWSDGNLNGIVIDREQRFPHSLGLLYSAFTAFLGFKVNNGEYKVMGMAPYGEPRYVDKIYDQIVQVQQDGSFWLNMDYFAYHYSAEQSFSPKLVELFGEPRRPDSPFIEPPPAGSRPRRADPLAAASSHYANVAASIQRVTEETLLRLANRLSQETGSRRLCLAGGVALNSSANGRILRETPFEELFIQPAAGDSGAALGAALYAYHVWLRQPRRFVLQHTYWGQGYGDGGTRAFLDSNSIPYEHVPDEDRLLAELSDDLLAGKVVGLFQGRFEWGPRALGNRSILADPRRAAMKEIVNSKIKFREPFRPFAPVVLEERCGDYFELEKPERQHAARHMLLVCPVRELKQQTIPAVTHVGGTSRIQTVARERNPRYYDLVARFGKETGVPVLLNTSFNLRGEPIAATPADAYSTYVRSGIDTLALEDCLVRKTD
jgi:carbamoyltransferase